ncbi:MAG: peptidoglycan DD-metalloendopeptidase family protein [Flavobacteriales bacterium]
MKKGLLILFCLALALITTVSFAQDWNVDSILSTSKNKYKVIFSKDFFVSEQLSGTLLLYENGISTFTPFDIEVINKYFKSQKASLSTKTMKIFTEYWDTTRLFPYKKIDLSKMTDSIVINFQPSSFFCAPVGKLNSPFGPRGRRQHKGIDTGLDIGDTLRSVFDGKIRYAQYNTGGYGNLVIIRHHNGLETYYAHQSKMFVKAGDMVSAGDVIGLGGETGNALGPHLHFEIRYMDNAFNPEKIIDLKNKSLKTEQLILTKKDFAWIKQWSARKYHTVKSGDTLSHLARKHHTSIKKILKINKKLKMTSILNIGQKVRVR